MGCFCLLNSIVSTSMGVHLHVYQQLAVKFRLLDANLTMVSVALTFCTAFK